MFFTSVGEPKTLNRNEHSDDCCSVNTSARSNGVFAHYAEHRIERTWLSCFARSAERCFGSCSWGGRCGQGTSLVRSSLFANQSRTDASDKRTILGTSRFFNECRGAQSAYRELKTEIDPVSDNSLVFSHLSSETL
jgi:hypothetical protein